MRLHPEYKKGLWLRTTLAIGWILVLSGITITGAFFFDNPVISGIGIAMMVVGALIFRANEVKNKQE